MYTKNPVVPTWVQEFVELLSLDFAEVGEVSG